MFVDNEGLFDSEYEKAKAQKRAEAVKELADRWAVVKEKMLQSAVLHYLSSLKLLWLAMFMYWLEWPWVAAAILVAGVLDTAHTLIAHCKGDIR
jgi:hypothetical protein